MKNVIKGILPAMLLWAAGCGSSSPGTVPAGTGPWVPLTVGSRWTYQVTEADGTVRSKVQGVMGSVPVGGTGPFQDTMAFRLVTGTSYGDKMGDVSFQAVVDSRLVRFRELSIDAGSGKLKNETFWDPPKLRVDDTMEHTVIGAKWPESYTEHVLDTANAAPDAAASDDAGAPADAGDPTDAAIVDTATPLMDLWSVVAVSDPVTVPAGTFNAIKLKRIQQETATIKYFWFARGIGKVKEAGEIGSPEQTEELVTYSVVPAAP